MFSATQDLQILKSAFRVQQRKQAIKSCLIMAGITAIFGGGIVAYHNKSNNSFVEFSRMALQRDVEQKKLTDLQASVIESQQTLMKQNKELQDELTQHRRVFVEPKTVVVTRIKTVSVPMQKKVINKVKIVRHVVKRVRVVKKVIIVKPVVKPVVVQPAVKPVEQPVVKSVDNNSDIIRKEVPKHCQPGYISIGKDTCYNAIKDTFLKAK